MQVISCFISFLNTFMQTKIISALSTEVPILCTFPVEDKKARETKLRHLALKKTNPVCKQIILAHEDRKKNEIGSKK